MKLSVLIWNNDHSNLESLLLSIFKDYNARDTEVIVVDKGTDKMEHIIDKFENKIEEGALKIIFSNLQNYLDAMVSAANVATGDYLLFLSSSSILKDKTIEQLLISLGVLNPDVVETEIKFSGSISMKYKAPDNIKRNVLYDAKKTVDLFAYISPFLDNKIIKKDFFKRVYDILGDSEEIVFSYRLLHEADTYLFIESPKLFMTIKEKIDIVSKLRQWEYLIRYLHRYEDWDRISKAVEYSYIKYLTLYLGSVLKVEKLTDEDYRWKLMIQEKISKLFPDWKENEYILRDELILDSSIVKEQTTEMHAHSSPKEQQKNAFVRWYKRNLFNMRQFFRKLFKKI